MPDEVTDTNHAIMVALAGQLASKLAAVHELTHEPARRSSTGLPPLRRRYTFKPDRHTSDLDRVAVAHVRHRPHQRVGRENW